VLFQGGTIEHLADLLRQQAGARPASPLVPIQPAGSKRPFFCVHPSGGNVLCYADLARQLGQDQPFYGLEAPDDGEDHDYEASIEAMAAHYLEAVRAVQPAGPYLLGGWSFGGLVAFEMARQLVRDGEQVDLLALLDTMPPAARLDPADTDDCAVLSWLAGDLAEQTGRTLALPVEELRRLSPDERVLHVAECLALAGVELPGDRAVWIRNFLKGYRARIDAAQRYAPLPYPGQITLFRAKERDPDAERDDPLAGWSALSDRPLAVFATPGRHAEMVFEPHVSVLAERLRACLDAG
jgi:thioesterase domain-containing protein